MTDTGDEHLYKLAADAQNLDKRPLLDRLREAAKTSHYSLYAEAYCALRTLAAEKDLVQIMLDTARKAYRELEPALADALSENDALRSEKAEAEKAADTLCAKLTEQRNLYLEASKVNVRTALELSDLRAKLERAREALKDLLHSNAPEHLEEARATLEEIDKT